MGRTPPSRLIDITGQRFGRLVVLGRSNRKCGHGTYWLCKCDCGNETVAESHSLRAGTTRSCGCLNNETRGKATTKHGRANKERLYSIWCSMRARCERSTASAYANYGGRGIRVCDEWHDYANFRKWAFSNGYEDDVRGVFCSIERIDNDGNYSPENCKFVTAKEQANNRRSCKKYTIGGVTKNATEWAAEYGICASRVLARLESGWSIEDALTVKPVKGRNQTWKLK